MYARQVQDRTLTFTVSGFLWNHSLVMMDQETGGLWSHLLGVCKRGELEGEVLEIVPSLITDWGAWKARHPATTVVVLPREAFKYRSDRHGDHILPQLVIGLVQGEHARQWPFDQLAKQPLVNDSLGGAPIVVAFDRPTATAVIFSRRVDDHLIEFELDDGQLLDSQTNHRWDAITGKPASKTSPASPATPLKLLPGVISLRYPWEVFHPDTTTWDAP